MRISISKTVIIIPCYNEAVRLDLRAFSDFRSKGDQVAFVFVNDGSNENTRALLDRFCSSDADRFTVIHLVKNRGKGEAVRQGFLVAMRSNPDYIGFFDADLATPLSAIPTLTAVMRLRPSVDMVLGARVQLMGREIIRRPVRHYLGRCGATAISFTLNLPIYDTQCGAKLFRNTDALSSIFAEPFITRWLFDVEIIARYLCLPANASRRRGEGIYELPLDVWRDVENSKVGPWQFIKAFFDLARIYLRYPRLR